ncbi:MAG: sulfate adenylyltransferase [Candidatus Dojkabacteria bacterium]
MNEPHGGKLINRFKKRSRLDLDDIDLKVNLDNDQVAEVRNIAMGLYSPLTGYMNEDDFNSVLDKMRLSNGIPWSIPIFLPIPKKDWDKLKPGSKVLLQTKSGKKTTELAVLTVSDKYKFDRNRYTKGVYDTTDTEHPGVKMVHSWSNYVIGGDIWVFGKFESIFKEFDLSPAETRKVFENQGWKTIVGFQTRNPAHRAHEFIQKTALEFVDGLFINPIIGKKKSGDFKDDLILAVYKDLTGKYYPANSTHVGIYNSRMNYAGPKEAVFHAIVRKNFGCTHFIVGRDHAGVGDYYDSFAAHRIFDEIENLGMEIMKVSMAFYCRRCDLYTTSKICPHNEIYRVSPSGTQIREYISNKDYESLRRVMRDDVLDIIFSFDQPFVS